MPRFLPPQQSIRTRLVLWNTLTLAGLFVLMNVLLHYSVSRILMAAVDRELDNRTQHIVDFPPPELGAGSFQAAKPTEVQAQSQSPDQAPPDADQPPPPEPSPGKPYTPGSSAERADYRPRILSPQGQVLKPGGVQEPWDARTVAPALRGQTTYSTITRAGEPLRIVSRRFPAEGTPLGVIQDVFSLAENHRILGTLDRALLLVFPLTLLCAVVGSTISTRSTLNQVRNFTESANGLSARDLSQRLPIAGQDEFATLATTFNAMLERLEASFGEQKNLIAHLERLVEQQRRFTADASHELRTPLTTIKANTSLFLSTDGDSQDDTRPVMEDIDQAASAMSHLVDDLLLLARSDEGQLGRNRALVSLRKSIEEATNLATSGKSQSDRAALRVEFPPGDLLLYANETEIVRLFTNLIVNALHYTSPQGQITISAVEGRGLAHIRVADTGIGIAPQHLAHLGERFFRVDTSRTRSAGGTGLGLSICKSITAAHGGNLQFESTLGVGTTVTVRLPLHSEE